MIEVPPKVLLQTGLDAVDPELDMLQVVLPDLSSLSPDEEQHGEDKRPKKVDNCLEIGPAHGQNGMPFKAAPSSSVFMSSMGFAGRKTGVLAPTVCALLASSILAV